MSPPTCNTEARQGGWYSPWLCVRLTKTDLWLCDSESLGVRPEPDIPVNEPPSKTMCFTVVLAKEPQTWHRRPRPPFLLPSLPHKGKHCSLAELPPVLGGSKVCD